MNTYLKDDVDDEEDGEEEDRFASSVVTSEISTIIYLVGRTQVACSLLLSSSEMSSRVMVCTSK